MPEILLLNDSEVRACLIMREAIESVEKAFADFGSGHAQMPPKVYLDFPQYEGDLRVMPAALGKHYSGVKIVNSHPRNPRKELPAVMGVYVLVAQETGMPLAIMSATVLTGMRTGAASGLATRLLARKDASVVGLIGAGVQARFQAEALSEVLTVKAFRIWAPDFDWQRRDKLIDLLGEEFKSVEIRAADELAEACAADVVCTTTPSREPLVLNSMIGKGTHINAVGADGPGKRELDSAILRRARVIVDEINQARHGGEVNVPLSKKEISEDDIDGSLADLVSGKLKGRANDDEVTVFDSTGLAIEDIALGALVYERAIEKSFGIKVEL